jgi:hypothetical protein
MELKESYSFSLAAVFCVIYAGNYVSKAITLR